MDERADEGVLRGPREPKNSQRSQNSNICQNSQRNQNSQSSQRSQRSQNSPKKKVKTSDSLLGFAFGNVFFSKKNEKCDAKNYPKCNKNI